MNKTNSLEGMNYNDLLILVSSIIDEIHRLKLAIRSLQDDIWSLEHDWADPYD